MLRIIRGADCHWVIGERRFARVPLQGGIMDWRAVDRQTALVRAADQAARTDDLLAVTVMIPPGSDFEVAAVLASCEHRARESGAAGVDFTLHCDQPDRHLDQCLLLLTGAHRIGEVAASMITSASALTPGCSAALERAGFRYVQVTLDSKVTHVDRALARDLANLRQAATSSSMLWHVRVSLTSETVGAAGTLLKMLAEEVTPSSLDVSFAVIDEPRPELGEGDRRPRRLGDSVVDLYLQAQTAGFSLRLPLCHRCPACDARGDATSLVLNADGMPDDARPARCLCAEPDQFCASLTSAVQDAVLNHLYAARSVAPGER